MRKFATAVFETMRTLALPLSRLEGLRVKVKTAPTWGGLVVGRNISASARCNDLDHVFLGQRCSLGADVELRLSGGLYGNQQVPAIRIGDLSSVGAQTTLYSFGSLVDVGRGSHIGTHCHLGAYGKGIRIGADVLIASHCSMVDTQHVFATTEVPIVEQGITSQGIVIEDDVWLGSGVVVMDGVTVGRGAIVGAGSVVTKNIPPMAIAFGTPARVKRFRSSEGLAAPESLEEVTAV